MSFWWALVTDFSRRLILNLIWLPGFLSGPQRLAGSKQSSLAASTWTSSFHLVDAQELQSLDLPALNNVTGTFEIQTVGLTYDTYYVFSLDFLVSSFIIGGIPKVRSFQLTAGHVGLLEVQGNGFLEFVYSSAIDYNRVDTLSVSGCGNLVFGNIAVDTLIVSGNTISILNLSGIQTIKTLRIQNNRQLTDVGMPWPLTGFGLLPEWQNLEISGNPLLQSARIAYGNPPNLAPIQNLSSMVFTGPFDYAWLRVLSPSL
ncbi:hypothetical protein QBC46DRAFT_405738 [Diplogelasinospora grovesii]|uniref:Uncharacterized protein n=1 Tax=Diplogelasinospora grovesii TaxID=303347 RepID=A0AAN6S6I5_9PEZI|nr:hypothetical protein QBC46DRAFT_405738 [Diplogelasinospora grovesii]